MTTHHVVVDGANPPLTTTNTHPITTLQAFLSDRDLLKLLTRNDVSASLALTKSTEQEILQELFSYCPSFQSTQPRRDATKCRMTTKNYYQESCYSDPIKRSVFAPTHVHTAHIAIAVQSLTLTLPYLFALWGYTLDYI